LTGRLIGLTAIAAAAASVAVIISTNPVRGNCAQVLRTSPPPWKKQLGTFPA
jgi:hypothetical protein